MFAVQDNVGIEAIAAACMKNKTKIINRLKFLDEKKVSLSLVLLHLRFVHQTFALRQQSSFFLMLIKMI